MSTNIQKALDLAYEAHKGQTTFSGNPYIFHPIRVMEQMDTEEEKCVALLHDVVEDTDVTLSDIVEAFTIGESGIAVSVSLLTHEEGISYEDYIKEVGKNYMATKVKIADLRDNMRVERLPYISQGTLKRLKKYHKALNYLLELK